jgi:hypothetical protein
VRAADKIHHSDTKRHSRIQKQKNLTRSRLHPISPFSYVGQGRKGAKKKERQNPREPHRFIRVVRQRRQRLHLATKTQRTRSLKSKGSLEICSFAYGCLAVFAVFANFRSIAQDLCLLRVLCVFVVKLIFPSVNSCASVEKIPRAFGTGRQIQIQYSSFIAPEASIKGILIGNMGVVSFSI